MAAANQGQSADARVEVAIHVYDLDKEFNDKVFAYGFGLYHTGIEVDGIEYWFQGHQFPYTGVVALPHVVGIALMPLRESVQVGFLPPTPRSRQRIRTLLNALTLSYRGNSYHPLKRNCNSFTAEFANKLFEDETNALWFLCRPFTSSVRTMPGYVNRMANMGATFTSLVPEKVLWRCVGWYFGQQQAASNAAGDTSETQGLVDEGTGLPVNFTTNEASPIDPNSPPDFQRQFSTAVFMNYFGVATGAEGHQEQQPVSG
eukprot:TRINITY_DN17266_c0_g1_i1.p1 TRINITY_DN17266_c0_g1~~TRINITY_DN17266_c0_g1_i1.p1  ORF type:complete len:275 (-),score=80.49 TRINITY_DN17266_c0_g1_i1:184-960(-)